MSAITIPLIVVSYFFLFKVKKVNSDNPEFRKYISAYTSGVISKKSTIKIKLLSDVVDNIPNKEELPKGLFKISPSVDGEYSWSDDYTIEFTPEKNLESGVEYFVKFALGDLVDTISNDLESFNFTFKTITQSFDIVIDEQKTIDKKTLRWQQVLGYIQTADYEDLEAIQEVLSARQESEKLKISWTADFDNNLYYFTIDSISRTETESSVIIKWDGESIGVEQLGNETLKVYALDDFQFISAKVYQEPEQYLQIQFSDPLLEDQDLTGLITIADFSNLRYIIENNIVRVYPAERIDGVFDVFISDGVKNILGYKLKQEQLLNLAFEKIKPAVRLLNSGVILPSSEKGLIFPFESVNLKAVDVTIIKIYEDNVMQFLQVNDYSGDYELTRVGEPILRKTVYLDSETIQDYGKWNRFSLDLSSLIETEPGAIYRIEIGFRQYQSLYECTEIVSDDESLDETDWSDVDYDWGPDDYDYSYYDYWDYDYYWDDSYWENRENPCNKAYYSDDRKVAQNIISSNIGLIAKKGNDGSMKVFVNDLLTTETLSDVTVNVYNYQNKLLESATTGNEGYCSFEALEKPYFIIAEYDNQKGYLKIDDGSSLSLSQFDISGTAVDEGIKGFIYTERGVWRPGDSIYLTFILKEELENLPQEHPIVFSFKNPEYQTIYTTTATKNETGFYSFPVATSEDDITGNYNAYVTVGSAEFYKKIKIETVKPNRLKINLDLEKDYIARDEQSVAKLDVKWLTGSTAKNLNTEVEVTFSPSTTTFSKFSEYIFDDNSKYFSSEYQNVFDGKTDSEGKADVKMNFTIGEEAPGKLNTTFVTRAYEVGGNFSISQFTTSYYPYKSFVGLKLPEGDKMRGMLLTDTTHFINIVLVDKDGNLLKENHEIKFEFLKLENDWWWDSNDGESNYISTSYATELSSETVTTKDGKADWSIRVNYPDWGQYFVRATDLTTGHSSSQEVFIDWPGWAGKAQREGNSATMLSFSADKEAYNVGETVNVSIPSSAGGRALISIENGTSTLQTDWIETKDIETNYSFIATAEMSPNIFINVTMLQPHAQTANDLPIRMYGIINIGVEDPETHLEPVISMPNVLEAEGTYQLKISEKNNKPMTYTIAIVDEGLLDLTNFETPNPWDEFYAREALGVKTWDIYDWVIGAYSGEIEKLISIGGDSDVDREKSSEANRFTPVVMYLGPFESTGGANNHTITLPNYIGSVRTMIIAGKDEAYGSAEKTTAVIKPLMLLGTLPRVLGPSETIKLPVTVFAMDEKIKNATVTLNTNEFLKVSGSNTQTVKFTETGEQNIEFDLEVAEKLGIGTVELIAVSGNEKATYSVEIQVRNPNPEQTNVESQIVEKGKSWSNSFTPFGMEGTNSAVLEVSTIPPINLEKRLSYLISYPYGCIEQTTSAVFAQLYLSDIMDLTSDQSSQIQTNVKAAIDKIVDFQLSNGGLSYWQGGTDVTEWGTNYAGHFMLEAQDKGFVVPMSFIKNWKEYQKTKASNWTDDGERSQFTQAYRLYTLALADEAQIGAMNRLKELKSLDDEAKWQLAAAYYLAGKEKVATELVKGLSTEISEYSELSNTFGSDTRDKAIILETFTLMNKNTESFELIEDISTTLSSSEWLSTQTIAYSLVSISKYYKKNKSTSGLDFTYTFNGKTETVKSDLNISTKVLDITATKAYTVDIENNTDGILYARVVTKGIPVAGDETSAQNKLTITVFYRLLDGTVITPNKITQGTDFVAEVLVSNPGLTGDYEEMALSQIFPSGWEIINTRLFDIASFESSSPYNYQDIRDDRVYTFFDLPLKTIKTYRVLLNASYVGHYYLPSVYCEAMYDGTINARNKGMWVDVVGE